MRQYGDAIVDESSPNLAGPRRMSKPPAGSAATTADAPWEAPDSVGLVTPQHVTLQEPLITEGGGRLDQITLEYECYGTLNADKSNAILICHALSGDAHAAGWHSTADRKPGWWDKMIGPGKAFDTNRYFVVSSNVLGGCMGSTGPASPHPRDGKPYGIRFPIVTVHDMVAAQRRLMDRLGIERWFTVAGGSLGGMQVLEWGVLYPERVLSLIPIATTARLSAQGIAFNEVGRRAIVTDPSWHGGNYYEADTRPDAGLAVARMIGHITYLSEDSMQDKFGRRGQKLSQVSFTTDPMFEVESYLHYQGNKFTQRFDANSYLYLTKAMDLFDLAETRGSLKEAFRRTDACFLVISFSSDWLFPPSQSKTIVQALRANLADVTYFEIESSYGHDAFLLEAAELTQILTMFLDRVSRHAARG